MHGQNHIKFDDLILECVAWRPQVAPCPIY